MCLNQLGSPPAPATNFQYFTLLWGDQQFFYSGNFHKTLYSASQGIVHQIKLYLIQKHTESISVENTMVDRGKKCSTGICQIAMLPNHVFGSDDSGTDWKCCMLGNAIKELFKSQK